MKICKILFGAIAIMSLILLSACSTFTGKNGQEQNSGALNANQTSQENGANEQSAQAQGYGAERNNFASNNPMCQLAAERGGVNQHFFFDFNKSGIRPQYKKSLQLQANYLAAHPNITAKVTGNTDDRGSREYNIALGWRRAQAVARILEQYGVKKSQLKLVSYGAEKPVLLGTTEAEYQCNRRSDVIYAG